MANQNTDKNTNTTDKAANTVSRSVNTSGKDETTISKSAAASSKNQDPVRKKRSKKKIWFNLGRFIARNSRIVMPLALAVCIFLTIVLSVTLRKGLQKASDKDKTSSANKQYSLEMEENAHPEVNELIQNYYTAMAEGYVGEIEDMSSELSEEEKIRIRALADEIDQYKNINVYTKKGPVDGSYVVYVTSDINFKDGSWDVPGLQTFYVCTNDDGELYINSDEEQDTVITDYIQSISVEDDVVDLSNKVTADYNQLLADEPGLESFMEQLSANINLSVGQALAELKDQDTSVDTDRQVSYLVANDIVNVRSSDSETASKVGQTVVGDEYPCVNVQDNGWTEIVYDNQNAFVKTQYFQLVYAEDSSDDASSDAQTQDEAADEVNDADDPGSYTSARAKEAVTVRKGPGTDQEVLGTVYPEEVLTVLDYDGEGWSKVEYDGQTGYVKSEFFDFQ